MHVVYAFAILTLRVHKKSRAVERPCCAVQWCVPFYFKISPVNTMYFRQYSLQVQLPVCSDPEFPDFSIRACVVTTAVGIQEKIKTSVLL